MYFGPSGCLSKIVTPGPGVDTTQGLGRLRLAAQACLHGSLCIREGPSASTNAQFPNPKECSPSNCSREALSSTMQA